MQNKDPPLFKKPNKTITTAATKELGVSLYITHDMYIRLSNDDFYNITQKSFVVFWVRVVFYCFCSQSLLMSYSLEVISSKQVGGWLTEDNMWKVCFPTVILW